jgi:hypothetical protein
MNIHGASHRCCPARPCTAPSSPRAGSRRGTPRSAVRRSEGAADPACTDMQPAQCATCSGLISSAPARPTPAQLADRRGCAICVDKVTATARLTTSAVRRSIRYCRPYCTRGGCLAAAGGAIRAGGRAVPTVRRLSSGASVSGFASLCAPPSGTLPGRRRDHGVRESLRCRYMYRCNHEGEGGGCCHLILRTAPTD